MEQPTDLGSRRRRSEDLIFVLPNLFTTANLFAGFYSILSGIKENWNNAALAIIIAGFLDGLDGRIARMTKTQTAFGEQYDSMSDLMSFGIAPALLMYHWALAPYGRLGWFASFMYLTCAALRLARFNVLKQTSEKRYFQGCPSPLAAGTAASAVLFYQEFGFEASKSVYILIIMFALAMAMISMIHYRSFKDTSLLSQRKFGLFVLFLAFIVLLSTFPERLLFPIGVTYVVAGPITAFYRWIKRRRIRNQLKRGHSA